MIFRVSICRIECTCSVVVPAKHQVDGVDGPRLLAVANAHGRLVDRGSFEAASQDTLDLAFDRRPLVLRVLLFEVDPEVVARHLQHPKPNNYRDQEQTTKHEFFVKKITLALQILSWAIVACPVGSDNCKLRALTTDRLQEPYIEI